MRILILAFLISFQAFADDRPSAFDYVQNHPEVFQPDQPEVLTKLKKQFGDEFAQDVMTIFINKIVQDKSCDSLIGSCDFYLCQELKNPCGIDGYNLGFGYKYCSRSKFKLLDEMKTTTGKEWVPKTFQCLQTRSLQASLAIQQNADLQKDTCKSIRKMAFNSHPDCYAEAGYCELSILEKANIVELIFFSALKPSSIKQGITLNNICAKKIRVF